MDAEGLASLCEYVQHESRGRDLIIMGAPKSGKSTLASTLVRAMAQMRGTKEEKERNTKDAIWRASKLMKSNALHSTLSILKLPIGRPPRCCVVDTPP
eukprot:5533730-Amphidinium_carterae.1